VSIEVRPIVPEEFEAFAHANATGFGTQSAAYIEQARQLLELDRTLAAFEDGQICGTTAIFSYDVAVPGGALPMAGVTWVAVLPTHRRRGVLSAMMRKQLSDVRERGEPLAGLWASESIIYGRFGYGLAAFGAELSIEREHTAFARAPEPCGRVRLIDREEALKSWPAVYEQAMATQPGFYSRNETWWTAHTLPPNEDPRGGFSGRFYVQYEEEGRPLGYARYRIRGNSAGGVPDGLLGVQELMATTDDACAALWQYLFGVDLVGQIEARGRPLDEPLLWMLADPRRLTRRPLDTLWLRIVDVPAALEGRRYAIDGRLAFEVQDGFCGWTAGRYELEVSEGRAACRSTAAEPELTLDIADLGAIYLGGVRPTALARAGRVEGDRQALECADRLFAWEPAPWCPEVF
jgi:predicted acetyltransferase